MENIETQALPCKEIVFAEAVDVVVERPDWFGIQARPDFISEYFKGRSLQQPQINWFKDQGVSILALATPAMVISDDIAILPDGSFEFARLRVDGKAVAVFTVPVSSMGQIIDLAAWHPETGQMFTYRRRAFALGEDELCAANRAQRPIKVWRSLLGWLRADRTGVVILDQASAWHRFDTVECVVAEDDLHAKQLSRLLWSPRRKVPIHVPALSPKATSVTRRAAA